MNQIICGDALTELRKLPEELVQCFVTSPPYWGLRDYGTAEWVGGDDACNHQVGRFQYPASDKQKSNTASAGHQARDTCPHCGAVRIDKQLGLEQTPEEYVENMVAVFREVWRVLRDDGTLWLNMGDTYLGGGRGFEYGKPKDMCGIPWRVAFALQADGWYLRSDIIWSKPNPMPESVTDRPTKAHEYIFLLSKKSRYFYDADAVREQQKPESIERYKYTFSQDRDKQKAEQGYQNMAWNDGSRAINSGGRNRRTVWNIPTQPYSEAHFAVFPPDLIRPCVLAGCPVGGTVLDPFIGSGTTALVAQNLNRQYIGIELNPEYIKIINKRLQQQRAAI